MADEKKVKVILHARCLVDGREREAGEEVEIEESIAEYFGVPVKKAPAAPTPKPDEKATENTTK